MLVLSRGAYAGGGVGPGGARPVDLLGGGDQRQRRRLPRGPCSSG